MACETPLRLFFLTRPLTSVAIGMLRLWPVLGVTAGAALVGPPPLEVWLAACLATAVSAALMYAVERRCRSPELPFRDGLLVIAASVSLGWMFFDILFVLAGLVVAQLVACVIAVTPRAPQRYRQLVSTFYRFRMLQ